jgi:hypothetical protein
LQRQEVIMFDRMGFRIVAGLFLVLALIAGAAAIGYLAYNAGLARGAAADSAQVAPAAGLPMPYYGYAPYHYGPFGSGFLGCLAPLFFLFLVFALFRLVVGGGMGWRRHGWGWGSHGPFDPEEMRRHWGEKAEAWHREVHGGQAPEPPKESTSTS